MGSIIDDYTSIIDDYTWREIRNIVCDNFCCEHDCNECKLSINDDNDKHRDCAYCRIEDAIEEFLEQENEK